MIKSRARKATSSRPNNTKRREQLLAEGYRFYAKLDRELAEEGLEATLETWPKE